MAETKYIVGVRQLRSTIHSAIEDIFENKTITEEVYRLVMNNVETVLEDDCEEYHAGSEQQRWVEGYQVAEYIEKQKAINAIKKVIERFHNDGLSVAIGIIEDMEPEEVIVVRPGLLV